MRVQVYEAVVRKNIGYSFEWRTEGGLFNTEEEAEDWILRNRNPFKKYRIMHN